MASDTPPEARLVTVPLGGGHNFQILNGQISHDVAEVNGDVIATVVTRETIADDLTGCVCGNHNAVVIVIDGVASGDNEHAYLLNRRNRDNRIVPHWSDGVK